MVKAYTEEINYEKTSQELQYKQKQLNANMTQRSKHFDWSNKLLLNICAISF